jgi:uncharacterized protein (TIRG00374 family)
MQYQKYRYISIGAFIGLFICILILLKIDLIKTVDILLNLNIYYLAASFATMIPYFFTLNCRWNMIMKTQGIEYSFKDSLIIYIIGFSAGVTTPGKFGEFIKVFYLKNDGYPLGKSFLVTLLDRLFDLTVLIFVAYFSLFVFIRIFEKPIFISSLLLVLIAALIVILRYKKEVAKNLLERMYQILIPKRFKRNGLLNFHDFYTDFQLPNYPQLCSITSLSIIIAIISFMNAYLLALSLGINISVLNLVACFSIATLAALIPISIFGIGVRDISLITLFSYIGLSSESAIAFSTLLLITYIISGLICAPAWFMRPLNLNINKLIRREDEDYNKEVK